MTRFGCGDGDCPLDGPHAPHAAGGATAYVAPAPQPCPTVSERVEAIHRGLYGGKSDPNRCVCADQASGIYADTPHRHYEDPPYACARCKCAAYSPAVPPPATPDAPAVCRHPSYRNGKCDTCGERYDPRVKRPCACGHDERVHVGGRHCARTTCGCGQFVAQTAPVPSKQPSPPTQGAGDAVARVAGIEDSGWVGLVLQLRASNAALTTEVAGLRERLGEATGWVERLTETCEMCARYKSHEDDCPVRAFLAAGAK